MKNSKILNNQGFSSIEVLVTLLFLTILLAGYILIVNSNNLFIKKEKIRLDEQNNINQLLDEIIDVFSQKKNEKSHGQNSKLLSDIPQMSTVYNIQVDSLSGKIDLNYLPLDFYRTDYFKNVTQSADFDILIEEYRNNGNLFFSYEEVKNYITEEDFHKYFTFYNLININVADEKSFENYINIKKLPPSLIYKRKSLLHNKQYVKTEVEAKMNYGINYEKLSSFVSIEAPYNINFIDKNFLQELISLPRFNQKNITQKINEIESRRSSQTLTKEDICNIFGISKNDELYYYLGEKTFFWEVVISGRYNTCSCVVSLNDNKVSLLKKQWLKTEISSKIE